jgi:phage tail tube protein FII
MGVESAIAQGGFIFVGTDNAGEDDLWRFYNVTRGRDFIHLMLLRTLRFYLGRFNVNGQTIQAILNTMDTGLRNLKADGNILGYEVKFTRDQNTPGELRQGRFTINFAAEEAPVARYLGIQSARYRPALDALLDDLLANLFCGDDDPTASKHLTLTELQLPNLQEMYQDHHPGGSRVQIEVAVGIQKLEASFKLAGWDPELLTQFGLGATARKKFTAYGSIRDKRNGTAIEAKAVLEGRLGAASPEAFQRGEMQGFPARRNAGLRLHDLRDHALRALFWRGGEVLLRLLFQRLACQRRVAKWRRARDPAHPQRLLR